MKTPRISVKLFQTLGVTVLVIIAAHSLIYQNLTRRNIANQLFLRAETLVFPLWQKVQFSLKVGGTTSSLYGLSHFCEEIKEGTPDLLEVAVLNSDGSILAHNDPSKLGGFEWKIPKIKGEKHYFIETTSALNSYLPVYRKNREPLLVKISFNKELLNKQTWQALWTSVLFSFTVISIFLVIIYYLTYFLLGIRLAQVLEGFEAIAKGRSDIRLVPQKNEKPRKGRDELDFLMESFDEMAAQLESVSNQQKRQQQQLSFLATHDQLTGLPNRRLFEHALKRAVAYARRGSQSAFLFMDLDNFKFVNDTLGHSAGDKVLISLIELLQKLIRPKDLLARFGGDEFALLLEQRTSIEDARVIAEQMCRSVEEFRFTLDGQSFHLGLSIGIVSIDGAHSPGVLLSQADTAMYNAKRHGRNRVAIFRSEDDAMIRLSQASKWATRIKDALKEDRFILYFQPVVRLNNDQIAHYEALIRLRSENGELIFPEAFIPAAEQFGLMPQLDRWVMEHVIKTLEEHQEIRLFMNLSSYSLADEALLKDIEDYLVQHGIEPDRLGFEITETALVQDLVLAELWIRRLKILGCQFALDDFGAGFNSFLYLRKLPVNQLKIDGLFIRTLGDEPTQRTLVEAMHELAQALGIETVAEFVETQEIVEILRDVGITYGQGFYLGRPEVLLSYQ